MSQENGPFIYTPTTIGESGLLFSNVTLQENPYSWSKVSQITQQACQKNLS